MALSQAIAFAVLEYFREAAEVIGAAAGGPPDRAKMMDVFRRHGMTVAAPPPVK